MRARISPAWIWGLVLTGGLSIAGLAQEQSASAPESASPPETTVAAPLPPATAEPTPAEEEWPPSEVQLSPRALEVLKLAQAQVEEAVILAYVTNCADNFNLGAAEIIYLQNVGVPDQVMNAMIKQRQSVLPAVRAVTIAAAPTVPAPAPSPAAGEPALAASAESWPGESLVLEDAYYAPEQPAELGPVRAPYPVKLNDPIVILKLPTLTVPYW